MLSIPWAYAILCPLLYALIYYLASLLSVSYVVARYALSIKYRGSVYPSVCVPCSQKHLYRVHTSRGSPSIFYRCWVCLCFILFPYVQISYCHQSTKKGEIVRAYLSLSGFGDWWQCICGLIVCIEHFRYLIFRHKTIHCSSESSEYGVFPTFLFSGFES